MNKNKVICGPCSAETREQILETAKWLTSLGYYNFRAGVWKPRTKPGGFEGHGEEALKWLVEARKLYNIIPYVEVANPSHVELCKKYGISHIWVGARTSSDPFATQELANSLVGFDCEVLVKNPISADLELWIGAIQRIKNAGVKIVKAIHRGFSDYNEKIYRNSPIWTIPLELKSRMPELEIYCDPSHISGNSQLIPNLINQAYNYGFDGFIIESHCNPKEAWTDAKQQLVPSDMDTMVSALEEKPEISLDEYDKLLLSSYRETINNIDTQLIKFFSERMKISKEIGELKGEHNMQALQYDRWKELLSKNIELGKTYNLDEEFISKIWNIIHEESIKIQSTQK